MKHYLKYTRKRVGGLMAQTYLGGVGMAAETVGVSLVPSRGLGPLPNPVPTSTPLPNPVPTSTPYSKLALLIGCEYVTYEKKGTMKRLPGCHMDIKMAQKMLMEHYGYAKSDFIILSDETSSYPLQPTRDIILQKLKWIAEQCHRRPTLTQVVIYYSGHGTQTPDKNGDEEDGMDECLVPSDFMEQGLIIDDMFFDCIWSKLPLSVKVTCIFDCCNSGTIFDLPYRYDGKLFRRDEKVTPQKLSTPLPLIVTVSGCHDPQTSASAYKLERNIDWEGAMSYALREVLKRHSYSPTPVSTLIDEMRTLLAQLKFSQIPQLGTSREVLPGQITQLF